MRKAAHRVAERERQPVEPPLAPPARSPADETPEPPADPPKAVGHSDPDRRHHDRPPPDWPGEGAAGGDVGRMQF
jgi:hypothetical protein